MREHITWAALELRQDSTDGRTVEGIAVPYGETTQLTAHGAERFAAGALRKTVADWGRSKRHMPLLRGHDQAAPIGKVLEYRDSPDGLHVVARLADTALGREAAQEVREGVLDAFSVGFRTIHATVVAGVREVREAALHELSLVPLPAYDGAAVLAVRAQNTPGLVVPAAPRIPARMLAPDYRRP